MPIELKIPNAETIVALQEDSSTMESYATVDDFFVDLGIRSSKTPNK
jgi:antitoxin component of RelBE/YafQ-DinJ toxin-antitoxin module